MANANVLKRGYLVDKKGSLLDRKRWYILRHDAGHGFCLLEYYKDEKSAVRGESPKGCVNILDVVEVMRLSDKKQTFELLCPGVAHRFMANSESDADEWADIIRKFILYKKGNFRTLSLPQPITRTHGLPSLSLTRQLTPLSTSPPVNVALAHHSPTLLLHPQTHHTLRPDAFTISPGHQQQNFTYLPNPFLTPPESILPAPTPIHVHPAMVQRQVSNDSGNPYPSPPSSSDSSSMCSGSNTSFDSATVMDGDTDLLTKTKFRVQVKENDKLNTSGPSDLIISDDSISLNCIKTGVQLVSWNIGSLRRYGVNNVCFTFDTGRNCSTGEGKFFFYSQHSRIINNRVHLVAQRLNKIKESRRASAPGSIDRATQQTTVAPPASPALTTAQHSDHTVIIEKPAESCEKTNPCTTLLQHQFMPPTNTSTATISSSPPTEYSKLYHHNSPHMFGGPIFTNSQTSLQAHAHYSSLGTVAITDCPLPSTSSQNRTCLSTEDSPVLPMQRSRSGLTPVPRLPTEYSSMTSI